MTVTELQRYATSQSLTVPLGVMPGYADLTIGGLLATGAHGFGGNGNSNVVSEADAQCACSCVGLGW
jgi:FAD/FMN-containing dehydrogenase